RGLAADLDRRGFLRGDRVLVHAMGGTGFVASVGATLLLGGVPILAEPRLGRDVYARCIALAHPRWHLVHPLVVGLNRVPSAPEILRDRLEIDLPTLPDASARRVLITDGRLRGQALDAKPMDAARVAPSDDALIVFTGGTSADPRGVRLSHGALAAYLAHIGDAIDGLPPFERFLADTPQQVLYALRLGKTAVTITGRREQRVRNVLRAIVRGTADAYFGSPWIWVEMLRELDRRGESRRIP